MKRRWLRRCPPDRPAEDAVPQGVRLENSDGRVLECDVLRDPDSDANGCAAWIAVPREYPDSRGGNWAPAADVVPGHTSLHFELPPPRCACGSREFEPGGILRRSVVDGRIARGTFPVLQCLYCGRRYTVLAVTGAPHAAQ